MNKSKAMLIGELQFFLNELPDDYVIFINGEPLGMAAANHELKTFNLASYPITLTQESLDQIYEDNKAYIENKS